MALRTSNCASALHQCRAYNVFQSSSRKSKCPDLPFVAHETMRSTEHLSEAEWGGTWSSRIVGVLWKLSCTVNRFPVFKIVSRIYLEDSYKSASMCILTVPRFEAPTSSSPTFRARPPHGRGTGYGLLAGAATVGLFKQNGTLAVLKRP